MKRQELERVMGRLEKEILPCFASSLASKKDELNNYSTEDFAEYAYELYMNARQMFLEMLEEGHIQKLEPTTKVTFMGYTASCFNSIIYPDHKFMFTINYTDEEGDYRFGFTTRELVGLSNNDIPKKAVPLIHAKTLKDTLRGKLIRIKLVSSPEDFLDFSS